VKLSPWELVAAVAAAVATPLVIIAAAVVLFLNPIWVGFDQGRSDVAALTGYTPAEVQQVTGSILSDLVFGPPAFDVPVNGQPVLDQRSRGHMADVRSVLMSLGLVALIAAVLLAAAAVVSRGRRWFWRAVGVGSTVLVGGVIVVGLAFAVFFDQAFELFHEIFFPPGTYLFDPKTEKLVQLFPDQFWSETSVAIAAAVLVLAVAVRAGALRLGREPALAEVRAPDGPSSAAAGPEAAR
jgi:integral membrane protein (TIGR01906 family)